MRIENTGVVAVPVKAPIENAPQASQSAHQRQPESVESANRINSQELEEAITPEMMNRAVEQANKSLARFGTAIERTVHEKTHAIIYILRDTVTNEVIREFPPKKIQDMIAKMWELAGLFVDDKG